ncbi:MAG: hypothetical protein RR508_02215 [Oscillospiraceae bacterium]
MKKLLTALVAVGIAAMISVTAFAAVAKTKYDTPALIVAELTDRTEKSVIEEHTELGKTYGTIANEAGKLTEFKAEILKLKKSSLTDQVEKGNLTQEEADAIIAEIEVNQALCDGTGAGKRLCRGGTAYGSGKGHNGARSNTVCGKMRLQSGCAYKY